MDGGAGPGAPDESAANPPSPPMVDTRTALETPLKPSSGAAETSEWARSTLTLAQMGRRERSELRELLRTFTLTEESQELEAKILKYTQKVKRNNRRWNSATSATIVITAILFVNQLVTFATNCIGIALSDAAVDGFQITALALHLFGFACSLTVITVNIFIFRSCGREQLQRHEEALRGAALALRDIEERFATAGSPRRRASPGGSNDGSAAAAGEGGKTLPPDFFG